MTSADYSFSRRYLLTFSSVNCHRVFFCCPIKNRYHYSSSCFLTEYAEDLKYSHISQESANAHIEGDHQCTMQEYYGLYDDYGTQQMMSRCKVCQALTTEDDTAGRRAHLKVHHGDGDPVIRLQRLPEEEATVADQQEQLYSESDGEEEEDETGFDDLDDSSVSRRSVCRRVSSASMDETPRLAMAPMRPIELEQVITISRVSRVTFANGFIQQRLYLSMYSPSPFSIRNQRNNLKFFPLLWTKNRFSCRTVSDGLGWTGALSGVCCASPSPCSERGRASGTT